MPKLPPFALANTEPPSRKHPFYLIVFFLLFAGPLVFIHLPLLDLPYFWDEHGQFIPTALDLLRHGWWVARSTIPNVHPPGVEIYLVAWYKLFGYSIPITRAAMLTLGSLGLLFTFLLAIELSSNTAGAPAFWPPLLLLVTPLFYTQSFMAQLDMPAMVFTLLTLLLFFRGRYTAAVVASVALVLCKETGLVTPFVLFLVLVWRREWKPALYFTLPAIALAFWLCVLHRSTGYWLGNPDFARYNVNYSLHPVRVALSIVRRIYYLFFAEFRFIATLFLILTMRQCKAFKDSKWRVTIVVLVANIVLVSVLGGAELERYLLPVLPLLYIAFAVALTTVRKRVALIATSTLAFGLFLNLFWNPPYPFAYENNYAMVDFVRLQQVAAAFAERHLRDKTIATAWPYTAALESTDYGFVTHELKVIETDNFHVSSIQSIPASKYDALITYTRTWAPQDGVISIPIIRRFLTHFYSWQPPITVEEVAKLGLRPRVSWTLRGQTISIYVRTPQKSGLPI